MHQMTHKLSVGAADGDWLVLDLADAQAPGCSPTGQRLPSVGLSSLWASLYIDCVNTPVRGWSQSAGSPWTTALQGHGCDDSHWASQNLRRGLHFCRLPQSQDAWEVFGGGGAPALTSSLKGWIPAVCLAMRWSATTWGPACLSKWPFSWPPLLGAKHRCQPTRGLATPRLQHPTWGLSQPPRPLPRPSRSC